jgi:hypothetical protein
VIVVGDVVGERGELRFERSIGGKLEVLLQAIIGDRTRYRPRRGTPGERAVVLDEALKRLPGEVEAVEAGIFALERGDDAQGLGVVVEAALAAHCGVERALAGMAEGRMTEIMGKRERLGQVLVKLKRPRHGARDLRHLEAVGQAGAVVIPLVINEHLGLVGQAPERRRMQDAVAVAGIEAPRRARRLGHEPPATFALIHGKWRQIAAPVD